MADVKDEVRVYRLKRDGLPPLLFCGRLVAQASNRWFGGYEQTRWVEVNVYQAVGRRGKQVVLEVVRHSVWQGEPDSHQVKVAGDVEELRGAIEETVPADLRAEVYEKLHIVDVLE